MRFLIIDDDPKSSLLLKRFLDEEAFAVDHATDATRSVLLTRIKNYDLLILNQTRPGEFGLKLCHELRTAGSNVAIISLVTEIDPEHRLAYFFAGVDDCLCRPFPLRELLARIRAVLRRVAAVRSHHLSAGGLDLNCRTQFVRFGGKHVPLSKKEFLLLEFLMRHKGSIVSRSIILEHVWDANRDPFSHSLDSHICSLRKKLGRKGRSVIRNIQGRGYLIEDN